MKNSRAKGAAGEREWAAVCREQGYDDVRRTAQYCGKTGDASDCVGLPGVHQEVKRVEKLNIYDAISQAERDAGAAGRGDLPMVAHRKNRHPWLVTMRAEDWFSLYREWEAGGCPKRLLREMPPIYFEGDEGIKLPTEELKTRNRGYKPKSQTQIGGKKK